VGDDDIGSIQDESFARATHATASSYPPERRLTASQLAGYLDRRAFAVIGSARPDGRPHAAMSAYTRRGTCFWLPTVAGSIRERNARAHPWLTMTVAEGDREEHVAVLIEGPVVIVPLDEVPADIRGTVGDWAQAWLRLDAARVFSYASQGVLPG